MVTNMASESKPLSALLLLPPPQSFSFGGVKQSFETSVSEVLVKLSKNVKNTNQIATLDVALEIPNLLSSSNSPRAKIFGPLQHYLSSIYTLITAVGATHNIEFDCPGGIDTRVIFIDHPRPNRVPTVSPQPEVNSDSSIGPIITLQTLAATGREWDHVFYVRNENGRDLADSFVNHLTGPRLKLANDLTASFMQMISCSGDWPVPHTLLVPDDQSSSVPHYSVAVGGTFDHLHIGHKLLLTATALALEPLDPTSQDQTRLLTIGVTGDALLVNKKFAEYLESWEERFQSTASFLNAIMDFSRPPTSRPQISRSVAPDGKGKVAVMQVQPRLIYKFVEIFDACGPTITDENISALVVSKETSAGGAMVNDERAKKDWAGLSIFEVDVLQSGEVPEATSANQFEGKISSTDIRRRRMNQSKV